MGIVTSFFALIGCRLIDWISNNKNEPTNKEALFPFRTNTHEHRKNRNPNLPIYMCVYGIKALSEKLYTSAFINNIFLSFILAASGVSVTIKEERFKWGRAFYHEANIRRLVGFCFLLLSLSLSLSLIAENEFSRYAVYTALHCTYVHIRDTHTHMMDLM